MLWAAVNGHFDSVPVADLERFQAEWLTLLDEAYGEVVQSLLAAPRLSDAARDALQESLHAFAAVFVPTEAPADVPEPVVGVPDSDQETPIAGAAAASTA